MAFDKNTVKEKLELYDVYLLLDNLDAEPRLDDNDDSVIVCRTICHNGDSHKLYYYDNTKLFHCFTQCGESFDIFDLISRVKDIDLNTSVYFVVQFFNLESQIENLEDEYVLEDRQLLKRYQVLSNIQINNDKIELPSIDANILNYYPQPRYKNWEKEYITKEICDYMNIRYNPVDGGILIPHYDENDRLIGIRQRTLIQENEQWGKYRPIKIKGKLRNHPLGFNLYGLNKAKDRIQEMGIAMVFESEKAVLQTMGYLGLKNNIAVGMCGSSLSAYQLQLLLDAGAKEICIGIDKDFHELYDEEYMEVLKKIDKICQKYRPYCNLSFMFDTKGLTGYKQSPTDCGKGIFLELWQNRLVV